MLPITTSSVHVWLSKHLHSDSLIVELRDTQNQNHCSWKLLKEFPSARYPIPHDSHMSPISRNISSPSYTSRPASPIDISINVTNAYHSDDVTTRLHRVTPLRSIIPTTEQSTRTNIIEMYLSDDVRTLLLRALLYYIERTRQPRSS